MSGSILSTLACTVSATGITAPSYAQIYASLQASYQLIYGSDVVLTPDTLDGQWLAVCAQAISDCNQATIATYNSFSPATAQGAGLSSVVKVNGLTRKVPSASSAPVQIVGQVGTQIINGVITDEYNLYQWSLPALVTIPSGGLIDTTATCQTLGAISAGVGTLTVPVNPQPGWQTVTNLAGATEGAPVETDPQLKLRQTQSTSLPSQTTLAGMVGALEQLPGVTAVSWDQNDTSTTDGNGVPSHTIAFVISGGTLQSIVNVIGSKKDLGTGTYGSLSGTFIDAGGTPKIIYYSAPTQVTIDVVITLTALSGYTTAIKAEIQASVAAYINALGIGVSVLITRLYVPAQLFGPYATVAAVTDPTTFELSTLTAAIHGGSQGTTDITIAWNQIAVAGTVTVTP